MGRSRKRILLCGTTETRKSTTLKNVITKYYEPNNERCIIYDPSRQETWFHLAEITPAQLAVMKTGTYRICSIEPEEFFTIINSHWQKTKQYGGGVFSEDASRYLTPNKVQFIYDSLVGLRHINADFWGITHSITETPGYIIRQVHEFIFHKTGDNWSKVKDRFPEHLQAAAEKIFFEVNDPNKPQWYRRALTINKTGSKTFGQ